MFSSRWQVNVNFHLSVRCQFSSHTFIELDVLSERNVFLAYAMHIMHSRQNAFNRPLYTENWLMDSWEHNILGILYWQLLKYKGWKCQKSENCKTFCQNVNTFGIPAFRKLQDFFTRYTLCVPTQKPWIIKKRKKKRNRFFNSRWVN